MRSLLALAFVFSAQSAVAGTIQCTSDEGALQISDSLKDKALLSIVTEKNGVKEALLTDFLLSHEGTSQYENGIANKNVKSSTFATPYGNWRLIPEVTVYVRHSSDSLQDNNLKNVSVDFVVRSEKTNLNLQFKKCSEQ